jgi:hypothetical protein
MFAVTRVHFRAAARRKSENGDKIRKSGGPHAEVRNRSMIE